MNEDGDCLSVSEKKRTSEDSYPSVPKKAQVLGLPRKLSRQIPAQTQVFLEQVDAEFRRSGNVRRTKVSYRCIDYHSVKREFRVCQI